MFTNISMTGTGILVYVLGLALAHFGVQVGNDQITSVVDATLQVVGFIGLVVGQVRRNDLTMGIIRN